MAESIFARVRRVMMASVEELVDQLERAGGTGVMREAIREVDRAIDEVRAAHEDATARRLHAIRQRRLIDERLAGLKDKARFAIRERRDDLAEAAVSRHLDFEAEAKRLGDVERDATVEARDLEDCLAALTSRKAQMEEDLAAFESVARDGMAVGDGPAQPGARVRRTVRRAEAAFERAMSGPAGAGRRTRADMEATVKVAEIDAMQRSAAVAQRMRALWNEVREG